MKKRFIHMIKILLGGEMLYEVKRDGLVIFCSRDKNVCKAYYDKLEPEPEEEILFSKMI
jgi:hypothetical protein